MDIKLQVLVCTFGERLKGIEQPQLPVVEGVEYLICCQNPHRIPLDRAAEALQQRKDIKVLFTDSSGLSNNRNTAFGAATAPFVLIADDDIEFEADGLKTLIEAFEQNPDCDIITVASNHMAPGRLPGCRFDLSHPPRGYYAISCEIALRREALDRYGLRMSPLAGIGAPYLAAGEEIIFLARALQRGAGGIHLPIEVFRHPRQSTGTLLEGSAAGLRAKGAALRVSRGFAGALLRLPLEALRSGSGFFKPLWWLLQGYCYSIKHDREL